MSKTYRQPNCREDWQDITKLRFKDADDKIVAVYIDKNPEIAKCPITVIRDIEAIGKYVTAYYDFNGLHEVERYTILIETEQPEPDAKMILKIMLSDFAVAYKPWSDCWVKVIFVNTREKTFMIGTTYNYLKFGLSETKELLFTRDGETILTYDEVVEELNND